MVTLSLSPEALAKLDALARARGQTRSGAVEAMILGSPAPDTTLR